VLVNLIDHVDRALTLDARQRPGFRAAPARLQGRMPEPEVREESSLNVAPLVWRREDMTGALQGPAGVLEDHGVRVSSLPYVSADGDEHARLLRLSGARLRTLCETHWNPGLRPALRRKLDPRMRVTTLEGDTLLLGAYFADCNNYFHFWVDAMCDLWFLGQCGVDMSSVRNVLMPWSGVRWQREIARLCGLPEERIVPLSSADGFVLEKLHLAVRTKGGFFNHDWIVSALRDVSGWPPPGTDAPALGAPGRRIYVTRGGALRRPLFNEPAVLEALAPFGFEVVDCASLSVSGQRALFANAEIVVAPHGAGLTNIVWARPGTKLVELMPRGHANPCFMDLASQAGVAYGVVPSTVEEDGVDPIYAGFSVDPVDVAVLVRRMLDG
jgi:hypothetical protein